MKKILFLFAIFTTTMIAQNVQYTQTFNFRTFLRGYTGNWIGDQTDTTNNQGLNYNSLKIDFILAKIFTSTFAVRQSFKDSIASDTNAIWNGTSIDTNYTNAVSKITGGYGITATKNAKDYTIKLDTSKTFNKLSTNVITGTNRYTNAQVFSSIVTNNFYSDENDYITPINFWTEQLNIQAGNGGIPTLSLIDDTENAHRTDFNMDNISHHIYDGDTNPDYIYTYPQVTGTFALLNGGQTFTNAIWNGTDIDTNYLNMVQLFGKFSTDTLLVGTKSLNGVFKIAKGANSGIDSQKTNSSNSNWAVYGFSQSFLGNGAKLGSVDIQVKKVLSPTGTIKGYLYASTGTQGGGNLAPTGSALDSTQEFTVSNFTTSYATTKFNFINGYTVTNATQYCFVLIYPTGWDASNYIQLGYVAFGSHLGNIAGKATSIAAWSANAAINIYFVAYTSSSYMTFNSSLTQDRTITFPDSTVRLLSNYDTTRVRTFSDLKYLKNADSTAGRTFSDLKYAIKANANTFKLLQSFDSLVTVGHYRINGTTSSTLYFTAVTTAPSTSIGVGIVNYYGSSATNFLGDPVGWILIKDNTNTARKVPYY